MINIPFFISHVDWWHRNTLWRLWEDFFRPFIHYPSQCLIDIAGVTRIWVSHKAESVRVDEVRRKPSEKGKGPEKLFLRITKLKNFFIEPKMPRADEWMNEFPTSPVNKRLWMGSAQSEAKIKTEGRIQMNWIYCRFVLLINSVRSMNGEKWRRNERGEDAAHVVKRAWAEGKLTFGLANRKHYLRFGGEEILFSFDWNSKLFAWCSTHTHSHLPGTLQWDFVLLDVLVRNE